MDYLDLLKICNILSISICINALNKHIANICKIQIRLVDSNFKIVTISVLVIDHTHNGSNSHLYLLPYPLHIF